MKEPHLKTRRSFLQTSLMGASTAWTVPQFVNRVMADLDADAKAQTTQRVSGAESEILVILQLAGGNDGLNTVVPYADDAYYRARPTLGVAPKELYKLDDTLGLHPNLSTLHSLYQEGELGIINGVGYPNPNRSHFVSTSIWETADPSYKSKTGWIGRYFDHHCAGADPTVGIGLKKNQPESFVSERVSGISLDTPELYQWIHGGGSIEEYFAQLNQPEEEPERSGDSISMLGAAPKARPQESNLDFLERVALDAQLSSVEVRHKAKEGKNYVKYPRDTNLGRSLSLIARMIHGGLPTKVYYASHGGFDTHNAQGGRHAQLLKQLDEGLGAFLADLKASGAYERVRVMTFSEFGRRVAENGSTGTDHGKASCLFVAGGGVKGGTYGKYPSLTDLDKGDLRHSVDFRSVYATLLEKHLKVSSQKVLVKRFETLGFIR